MNLKLKIGDEDVIDIMPRKTGFVIFTIENEYFIDRKLNFIKKNQ